MKGKIFYIKFTNDESRKNEQKVAKHIEEKLKAKDKDTAIRACSAALEAMK